MVILMTEGNLLTRGCAELGQLGWVAPMFASCGGRRSSAYLLEPGTVRVQCPEIASGNDIVVMLRADRNLVTVGCAEQGQLGRVAPMFTSRGGRRSFTCLLEPGTVTVQRPTATSFAGVNLDISFTGDILGRALSTGSSSVATGCVSCALRYHELPSRLDSRGHTQPGCGTTVTARLSRKMRDGTS
ncbi:regulator of chromosome condensation-like isoform X2 [Amblyomma americanum]